MLDKLLAFVRDEGTGALNLGEYAALTKTMAAKGPALVWGIAWQLRCASGLPAARLSLIPVCCNAEASMEPLVRLFLSVCPALLFKYSVLKECLITVCKAYELGNLHWPGDTAACLMVVFSHCRRIFQDPTKWEQAVQTCTALQVRKLEALRDMFEPEELATLPSSSRQLQAQVSDVSLDSQGFPCLNFGKNTVDPHAAAHAGPAPQTPEPAVARQVGTPLTAAAAAVSPFLPIRKRPARADDVSGEVARKRPARAGAADARPIRQRPAGSGAKAAAATPGGFIVAGVRYTRMYYAKTASVGVRLGAKGRQIMSLTVPGMSRDSLFHWAEKALHRHHSGASLQDAKQWALQRAGAA